MMPNAISTPDPAPSNAVTVIISSYNNWTTLEKTLWSLEAQDDTRFEVLIADDGSGQAFVTNLARFMESTSMKVRHIRQEDRGFRKAEILNKAVGQTSAAYLLFIDADILVRRDWIQAHRSHARKGFFMAGGSHMNLSPDFHDRLDRSAIHAQRPFQADWLAAIGFPDAQRWRWRLESTGWQSLLLDALTPRRNSFVGCNSACWRSDFLRVGGFDEHLAYGGVDRDLGIRLANAGVRGVRRRYSLACVHLDHERPYRDPKRVHRQKSILKKRRRSGQVQPDHLLSVTQAD